MQYQMFPLHLFKLQAYPWLYRNPPKGKPYSATELMILYDFFKLTYTLIEQFITAFWSPKLNDFQNIQEVVEMCSIFR